MLGLATAICAEPWPCNGRLLGMRVCVARVDGCTTWAAVTDGCTAPLAMADSDDVPSEAVGCTALVAVADCIAAMVAGDGITGWSVMACRSEWSVMVVVAWVMLADCMQL